MATARGRSRLAPLSLGVSVLATILVLRRVGFGAEMAFGRVPPWAHLITLAAFGVEVLARGARVFFVARGLGLRLTLGTSIRAQLAGDALGAVTPSRLGSDPVKIAVLRRDGLGMGQGGALVLAEMVSEATILLAAATVIAVLVPGVGWWVALGVGGYAVTVVAAGAAALVASGLWGPRVPTLWTALRLGTVRWLALEAAAARFRAHARKLTGLPISSVAGALGAGALHILCRLAVLPVLAIASGVSITADASWTDLVLRPFFILYATSLLPPPGGGGGVELTFAAVLAAVLPPAALAATMVWWRWYTFYLGALLGWLSVGVGSRPAHKILDTGPSRDPTPTFSGTLECP